MDLCLIRVMETTYSLGLLERDTKGKPPVLRTQAQMIPEGVNESCDGTVVQVNTSKDPCKIQHHRKKVD